MATNNKRREATRRQLERQLEERQRREARRKQVVLISSIVGTVVVIGLVVGLVLAFTGGSDDTSPDNQAAGAPSRSATASTAPAAKPCTVTHPSGSVVFDGVTVGNPTNLKTEPKVRSCSKVDPKALEYKDLVVGKGKAANPKSNVSVQYTGVLYKNGTEFDSSWARGGKPASFSLTGVVPGFTQGIGGSGSKVPPMKVGGRRIVILPSSLGYGTQGSPPAIAPNTSLVFVIDLVAVK